MMEATNWLSLMIKLLLVISQSLGFDICSRHEISPGLGDSGQVSYTGLPTSGHHCTLEITSCSACRLLINITEIHFSGCRERSGNGENTGSTRRYAKCHKSCPLLMLHEPAYSDVTTSYHYTQRNNYTSMSSTVVLTLCNVQAISSATGIRLQVKYSVIEKIEHFTCTSPYPDAGFSFENPSGVVTSPNFPRGYAAGETYMYTVHNQDPHGYIRMMFTDWDLAPSTRIKFYYNNACTSEPDVVHYGSHFRPVIQTTTQWLCIQFMSRESFSHRTSHMGFSANYWFTTESTWGDPPITACGAYHRYMSGGVLQFSPPQSHTGDSLFYDCVWAVFQHSAYHALQLDINLLNLANSEASLNIYSGLISPQSQPDHRSDPDSTLLDAITGPQSFETPASESQAVAHNYVYNSVHGFYLHLRGEIHRNDTIHAVFTSYSDMEDGSCDHSSDYLCTTTELCIDKHLVCDNIPNCLDQSDEEQDCTSTPSHNLVFWMECGSREFQCQSGGKKCVPESAVCDGWIDCQDNSDEEDCEDNDLEYLPVGNITGTWPIKVDNGVNRGRKKIGDCKKRGKVPCSSGDQCVLSEELCDGKHQCWDRSDEIDCIMSLPHTNSGVRTLDILLPTGIAICAVLSLCTFVLCIRTRHKFYTVPPTRRNSSVIRRSRTIRSVTSETPLTADLSRTPSLMAERCGYEGSWLNTPAAYHDVESSPGPHQCDSITETPPHSAAGSAVSSHLSPTYYGPGSIQGAAPCGACGSPLPPSLQSSPCRAGQTQHSVKEVNGKPQVFLFPDVPTDSEHTDDPLRQAAQAAAQATCNHCHQRLQYAESLPTSLTGDNRKLSTTLNPEHNTDDISSVRTDSPTHATDKSNGGVNCARTWDPRTFHALHQPHVSATSQPASANSCHSVSCSCNTHGRHRRRSTTRIRPNRPRFTSHRCYPTYGSNMGGYVSGVKPPTNMRHSSFHGMPSTSLNSPQAGCSTNKENAPKQRHSVSTVDEQITTTKV